MRLFIAPYNMRVSAARELAEALGGRRIRPEGSRYRQRAGDVIINWGRSDLDQLESVINEAACVGVAVNKIDSFRAFNEHGVPTVEWTTDSYVADDWLKAGDVEIGAFARTRTEGRGGQGMVPLYHGTEYGPEGDVFPHAPLYTKYFKRKDEYRVHVLGGNVVDVQKKRLRTEVRDAWRARSIDNPYPIRSHGNGWVFTRNNVNAPQCVLDASIKAVSALGLCFGAVDVGYNEHENRAAVFEVNTAPGIEGTTLEKYVDAFRTFCR